MPSFTLPTIVERAFRSFVSLSLEATFDITSDTLSAIKAQLPFNDKAYHAVLRESVILGAQTAELSALIGVHDFESNTTDSSVQPERRYVHYAVGLRTTKRPRTTEEGDWSKAVAAMTLVPTTHAAEVALRLSLVPSAVLAVKLPIPLGNAEAPGFSEIRGVRLVKPDSEEPSSELYSVILDRYRRKVAMSVHTVVEVSFGETILQSAYDRAIGIAELAAWEEETSNAAT